MDISIVIADYSNAQHQQDIPLLLNAYATDPLGGGQPLDDEVLQNVVPALAKLPHAFSVIAYADGKPAGLANCFEVFSTFACKPVVNIHDVVVRPDHRGKGISRRLLEKVEAIARAKGCCKLTLEVFASNSVAKSAYANFGFKDFQLDPAAGPALFWQKPLTTD